MKIYGEISKVSEEDDGTVIVEGFASSETVDSDGEVITSDAMRAALPDYMKFANIREMHQPKAAGVALAAEVMEDGKTFLKARIVDSEAVKKVKAGVYKAFSIGGRVQDKDKADKRRITALKLSEISLVDRPANPEAVMTCWKGEGVEGPESGASVEARKGMWTLARLAELLDSLACLQADAEWEATWEGDNSPVPAALKDAVAQLGTVLMAMTEEELNELKGKAKAAAPQTIKGDEMTTEQPKTEAAKVEAPAAAAVTETPAADPAAKAEGEAGLAKVEGDAATLAKLGEIGDMVKSLLKANEAHAAENAELKKRLAAIEARPAPAKGAVTAVPVAKSQDTGTGEAAQTPLDIYKAAEAAKDPVTMIKVTQAYAPQPFLMAR